MFTQSLVLSGISYTFIIARHCVQPANLEAMTVQQVKAQLMMRTLWRVIKSPYRRSHR